MKMSGALSRISGRFSGIVKSGANTLGETFGVEDGVNELDDAELDQFDHGCAAPVDHKSVSTTS